MSATHKPDLDHASVGIISIIRIFGFEFSNKYLDTFADRSAKVFLFRCPWQLILEENRMNASIAIQVLPEVKSDEELIRIVDEVIAYIKSTGLHCHVGPFETTIEGDSYDQLMDIVKECQHVAVRAGAPKVAAYVKIVYQPEGDILTIDKKITKHQD